jgi:small subunit ribosomal protein S9
LYDGTGKILLNGRAIDEYFPQAAIQKRVTEPLELIDAGDRYDIKASLEGGGFTGQSDALRLGIARALTALDPDLRTALKREGMLTRDSRVVERKKYGLRKARRAPQFTKR